MNSQYRKNLKAILEACKQYIDEQIGGGQEMILEVASITGLTNANCQDLKCGDVVVENDNGSKTAYIVSVKTATTLSLSYVDSTNAKEVKYEVSSNTWAYDETVTTALGGGGSTDLQYQKIKDIGDALNYIGSFEEQRYIDSQALYNLLVAKNYDLTTPLTDCVLKIILQGDVLSADASFTSNPIYGGMKITFITSQDDIEFSVTDLYDLDLYYTSSAGALQSTDTLYDFFQYLINNNIAIPINKNDGKAYIGVFNPTSSEDYKVSPSFGNIFAITEGTSSQPTFFSANEFKALKYTS